MEKREKIKKQNTEIKACANLLNVAQINEHFCQESITLPVTKNKCDW